MTRTQMWLLSLVFSAIILICFGMLGYDSGTVIMVALGLHWFTMVSYDLKVIKEKLGVDKDQI